jgi:hypothetical protein
MLYAPLETESGQLASLSLVPEPSSVQLPGFGLPGIIALKRNSPTSSLALNCDLISRLQVCAVVHDRPLHSLVPQDQQPWRMEP